MGTRTTITSTNLASTALRSSWRDALAARYELQQAQLRMTLEDEGDTEEHL